MQRLGQSFNSAGIALFARVALVRHDCMAASVLRRRCTCPVHPGSSCLAV